MRGFNLGDSPLPGDPIPVYPEGKPRTEKLNLVEFKLRTETVNDRPSKTGSVGGWTPSVHCGEVGLRRVLCRPETVCGVRREGKTRREGDLWNKKDRIPVLILPPFAF